MTIWGTSAKIKIMFKLSYKSKQNSVWVQKFGNASQ